MRQGQSVQKNQHKNTRRDRAKKYSDECQYTTNKKESDSATEIGLRWLCSHLDYVTNFVSAEAMDEATMNYINYYNYIRPLSYNNYLTPIEVRYR